MDHTNVRKLCSTNCLPTSLLMKLNIIYFIANIMGALFLNVLEQEQKETVKASNWNV